MNIENLRKMIKSYEFHCVETHYQADNKVVFRIETNDPYKVIRMIYVTDKNGNLCFDNADISEMPFDFSFMDVEKMLFRGHCSYIKHYQGNKVVELPKGKE